MAVNSPTAGLRVAGVQHLRLCSAQAKSLAGFYESALGFRQLAVEHLSGARALERFGVAGRTLRITLELGAQQVKLMQFVDQPGRAYPVGASASDLVFQHFALVVSDMAAAMAKLRETSGWAPITTDGPQQLPASSGGVTAFKFRDPEGHPLELLEFPANAVPPRWRHARRGGPCLGIDHSAISVADTVRSIAFYAALGLTVSSRSVNDDPAQARLDGLADPVVDVVAMGTGQGPPHVELLSYRDDVPPALDLRPNDVAATWLVFSPDPGTPSPAAYQTPVQNLVDPDGHHVAIVWPGG